MPTRDRTDLLARRRSPVRIGRQRPEPPPTVSMPAPARGPGPDAVLAGRYRLQALIARGGMGAVWQARDMRLERTVAVKVLLDEWADSAEFRARLKAEARHAALLGHPGVAAVFDYGEGDETTPPFVVLELVEGRPLADLLAERGALPPEQLADVLCQAAATLASAHANGVVHRDVKPANLLVRPDGTVKVTDFGIAQAAHGRTLTSAGHLFGTAQYLSPEQASAAPATPASDVYSLGVVGYEMATGRRPFDGEPMAVVLAHRDRPVPALPRYLPAPLRELIEGMLAKDPALRPSAGDVAAVAADWLAGHTPDGRAPIEGVTPRRATTQAPRAPARRRRLRRTAFALVLPLVALSALSTMRAFAGPAQVMVPRAVGLTRSAAVYAVERAGLRPVVRLVHDARPSGTVVSESPIAVRVAPRSRVELTVSEGPKRLLVDPSGLLGRALPVAESLLRQEGLLVHTKSVPSTSPQDSVLMVWPVGWLSPGASVTLTYAKPVPVHTRIVEVQVPVPGPTVYRTTPAAPAPQPVRGGPAEAGQPTPGYTFPWPPDPGSGGQGPGRGGH